MATLITDVDVIGWLHEERLIGADVLVEDQLITKVTTDHVEAGGATVIDGRGGTLIPGLIGGTYVAAHRSSCCLPSSCS